MILYYKFFHIRYMKHMLLASSYDEYNGNHHCPEHGPPRPATNGALPSIRANGLGGKLSSGLPTTGNVMSGIPGVFNCRLNPALKRKKKKPSTFVPPPSHPAPLGGQASTTNATLVAMLSQNRALAKSPVNAANGGSATNTAPPPPVNHNVKPNARQMTGKFAASQPITNAMPLPPSSILHGRTMPTGRQSALATRLHAVSPSAAVMNQLVNGHQQNNLALPSRATPVAAVAAAAAAGQATGGKCGRISSPRTVSDSDNISSGGSRVNIQQKLQEKKQQQLMQLREIEEEMKQGKLHPLDKIDAPPPLLPRAFPPQNKKQPWLNHRPETIATGRALRHHQQRLNNGLLPHYYHPAITGYRRMKIRSHTPEVLLAPHYLEKSRVYYDYPSTVLPPGSIPGYLTPHVGLPVPLEPGSSDEDMVYTRTTQKQHYPIKGHRMAKLKFSQSRPELVHRPSPLNIAASGANGLPAAEPSSEPESQGSLPRSYTLPRQFRYHKGNGAFATSKTRHHRKPVRVDCSSNNSSDGDVDSELDMNDGNKATSSTSQQQQPPPTRPRTLANVNGKSKRNETPL